MTTRHHRYQPSRTAACSAPSCLPPPALPEAQASVLASYVIGLGDTIQVRLWGAFNFEGALTVDPKGNIFLPNVGPLKVTGVTNAQLNSLVESKIKEVYQANVNVYASLLQAQPVKVFVTGYVRNPGLYGGVASDSLLNYLSKAGGVDSDRGSYVDIIVKRGTKVRSRVNLYEFCSTASLACRSLSMATPSSLAHTSAHL